MLASDVLNSLRFDIGDQGRTQYSQYQLLDKLNTALRMVNAQLCNMSSSLVTNSEDLTMTDGSAPLPDDFQSPLKVQGTNYELLPTTGPIDDFHYRILGDSLYSNQDVTLEYTCSFPSLTLDGGVDIITDLLPLPDNFFDLLKQIIKDLLAGSLQDTITTYVQQAVFNLAANRERTKLVRKKLFTL
jgi:hypothetical protein